MPEELKHWIVLCLFPRGPGQPYGEEEIIIEAPAAQAAVNAAVRSKHSAAFILSVHTIKCRGHCPGPKDGEVEAPCMTGRCFTLHVGLYGWRIVWCLRTFSGPHYTEHLYQIRRRAEALADGQAFVADHSIVGHVGVSPFAAPRADT